MKPTSYKRPFLLIVLAFAFLIPAWFGLVRFQQAFANRALIAELKIVPGLWYFALTGAIWALTALTAAVCLWLRLKMAVPVARSAVLLLVLYYWADRLAFTRSTATAVNGPFAIGLTVLLGAAAFAILAQPRQHLFFHHPRKSD